MRIFNPRFQFDYVLFAGDLMRHQDWTYTKQGHLALIENFTALLIEYFPNTPVLWTIGNHEGVPINK